MARYFSCAGAAALTDASSFAKFLKLRGTWAGQSRISSLLLFCRGIRFYGTRLLWLAGQEGHNRSGQWTLLLNLLQRVVVVERLFE